jgi:hypothetical protein
MRTGRAVLSGALIWFMVLALFGVLDNISATRNSQFLQGVIAIVLIIPFAYLGASIYYKSGDQSHGLLIGIVMVLTALFLDALITVPLIEQPYHGIDHQRFFSNPVLWIVVVQVLIVVWLFQRSKIARS